MRAARTIRHVSFALPNPPAPFTPHFARNPADALAVLGEVVAHLAERVELLETRERISRAALCRPKAGTVRGRE
jgi:hypothetical protein